jgi:ATP-dependent RNA helicase RhlE
VRAENYSEPTSIQLRAIPHLIKGRDLLGCAQTGSGKTAAFALPILQRLAATRPIRGRAPRALILAPTRELALQICDSFEAYSRFLPLAGTTIHGGVGQDRQVRDLARGVDILVATPGRLLDLMEQGYVRLDQIEVFVLDEADRMLDMGFIVPVRKIVKALPTKRQTLLFSATMPKEVASLAASMLTDPLTVEVPSVSATAPRIEESVVSVERAQKAAALSSLLNRPEVARALIFTRTKRGADKLVRQLGDYRIRADALHGNMSQNARLRTLDNFRDGRIRFLVATDIAARGIDIESITHIVNYDLPDEPGAYVHRIGRTARAGATGAAISLCSSEEYEKLREIEKLIKRRVPVVDAEGRPAPDLNPLPGAARLRTGAKSPHRSIPASKRPAPGRHGSGNNAVATTRRRSFGRNSPGR